MNKVKLVKYYPNGEVLLRKEFSPPSHMNVDFFMREVAARHGCPVIDGCVNCHVYYTKRQIEWLDDKGNMTIITHRMERAISYIEVRFYPGDKVVIRSRRSGAEIKRTTKVESRWFFEIFSLIRKWVEVGRMKIMPAGVGIGFVVMPVLKGWDSE